MFDNGIRCAVHPRRGLPSADVADTQQPSGRPPRLRPVIDNGGLIQPEHLEPENARPVFIVGAPRSGTSMLRLMLDRHPAIGLCDETHFFYYVYTRRRHFGDLSDPANRNRLVDRYLEMKNIRVLDLDLEQLASSLREHGYSYRRFFLVLLSRYAQENGKSRIGEKSPDHALHVETLCRWYPRCRIVHLARDPRAVVGSLQRMPWARSNVMANARWWRRNTTAALRLHDRENVLLVRYEELVSDPEAELRRICRHIDERYAEEMVEADRAEDHRPWTKRARRPVTRTRVDRWREELTETDVSLVEHVAGPLMEQLDYARAGRRPTGRDLLRGRAADAVDWLRHAMRTLPRYAYYWLFPTQIAAEEEWIDRWKVPGD